jgi:DNA-binding GntR family transcriptional regulator
VTASDLAELKALVDQLVEAGESGARREFLERDLTFHKRCWSLSGNAYLVETLERLMAPLFAFAVLASSVPVTAAMAREHYAFINALQNLQPPEFGSIIRKTLTGFALRWISAMTPANIDETVGSRP